MPVVVLSVSFLTTCYDVQWVNMTLQHQSPPHLRGSRVSLPYQSFFGDRKLRFTRLLTCVDLFGKHRPHRELWTGTDVDLSTDLVNLQVFYNCICDCAVTLQENTVYAVIIFQSGTKYSKLSNL